MPFFKACGLGSVLGYLVAGMMLGPHCLGLLSHAENIQEISQIGIIMLLFVIGLELTPKRISYLKTVILGAGLSQFIITTVTITGLLFFLGLKLPASLFVGTGLTLSSTAFALTYLRESDQLTKSYGQSSFGILLFQDIIIIPILTIIPFFTPIPETGSLNLKLAVTNFALLAGVLIFARFALKPLLLKIYESQSKEIFIGSCLMIITGTSLLMHEIGLSKALGALIAGVFLSNSGLRSDIQSFSVPLKAMMMGVFFMGFGLTFDVSFFMSNFNIVTLLTLSFMAVKFAILLGVGKYIHGEWKSGTKLGLILCQGGEFGLLVAALLFENSLIAEIENKYLVSSITLSIFIAPILTKIISLILPLTSTVNEALETNLLIVEEFGVEANEYKENYESIKHPEKEAA
ncbi:MAG: hypothetical protein HN576_13230 [Bacteriovoracaceae bacterium]|nr:hypothetical protein [Bacteriovoracaceae bacterium]